MKSLLSLVLLLFSCNLFAENTGVDMNPPAPLDPDERPPKEKMPARAPQVTITHGTLLTVGRIAEDATILLEILRDGEPFFSTFTLEHSITIPFLEPGHTYTINLTVNGTLWVGTYE